MKRPSKSAAAARAGKAAKKTAAARKAPARKRAVKRATAKRKPARKSAAWTPDQLLPDPAQEAFCQIMARGVLSGSAAYRSAAAPDMDPASASTMAWKWMREDAVQQRIQHFREHAAQKSQFDLERLAVCLENIITTPLDQLDTGSPLVGKVNKFGMPELDKGKAADLLATVRGWKRPQEVNVNLKFEPPEVPLRRALEAGLDVAAMLKELQAGGGKA